MAILVFDGEGGVREISHEEWRARMAAERAAWDAAGQRAAEILDGLNEQERWALRQALAGDGRFYGAGGTIHGTPHLDVETDADGQVVAVWFRCQTLPFRQTRVDRDRAGEMRGAYSTHEAPQLVGVEVVDRS